MPPDGSRSGLLDANSVTAAPQPPAGRPMPAVSPCAYSTYGGILTLRGDGDKLVERPVPPNLLDSEPELGTDELACAGQ